jgi:hypothetical protein
MLAGNSTRESINKQRVTAIHTSGQQFEKVCLHMERFVLKITK